MTLGKHLKFFCIVVCFVTLLVVIYGFPIWLISLLPKNAQLPVIGSLFIFVLVHGTVLPALHRRWGTEVLEADGWNVREFRKANLFVNRGANWPWWLSEWNYSGTVADDSDTSYEFAMSIQGPYLTWIRPRIFYNTRLVDDGTKGRKMTLSPFPDKT